MNLHRHDFVQFLRERPLELFATCDPCNCPAAVWLCESQGRIHTVMPHRIRALGTSELEAEVHKTPLWLADFVRAVDSWGASRMSDGKPGEIPGGTAYQMLEAMAV